MTLAQFVCGQSDRRPERIAPRQDNISTATYFSNGSAHTYGFNAVFCDGSVRTIRYSIAAPVYQRLGNRKDGLTIDLSSI